jgi:hypothetical protein
VSEFILGHHNTGTAQDALEWTQARVVEILHRLATVHAGHEPDCHYCTHAAHPYTRNRSAHQEHESGDDSHHVDPTKVGQIEDSDGIDAVNSFLSFVVRFRALASMT